MNGIFKQLLNVKGTVVEDVRIRCSRCGRKRRGYDRGGGRRR